MVILGGGMLVRARPEEMGTATTAITHDLERVYRDHGRFVWHAVRRLGVPRDEVEDVVQDVFVIVHRRLPEFEGRSSLKTWLFGVAYHVVRARRRNREAALRREQEVSLGRPPTEPERKLASRRGADALDAMLATLDDEQRSVFVMAEVSGMTAPEIAELTGAKLNTVYSRLRLARRAFESALHGYRTQHEGELPWTS